MSDLQRFILFSEHLADLLSIEKETARRWLAAGKLGKTIRVGKRKAVLLSELKRTLEERMDDAEGDDE